MNLIQLRAGPIMREDSILLALRLEELGHRIGTADGKLTVSNGAALTPDLRAQIKAHRLFLMALAAYEPPEAR